MYVCMVLIKTGARKVAIELVWDLVLDHIEIIDNYLFEMNIYSKNQK